jgi:hypothetical protein
MDGCGGEVNQIHHPFFLTSSSLLPPFLQDDGCFSLAYDENRKKKFKPINFILVLYW